MAYRHSYQQPTAASLMVSELSTELQFICLVQKEAGAVM
jgi:hypothetical protein